MRVPLRSFNEAFTTLFKDSKGPILKMNQLTNPQTIQQVIDHMNLKKLYPNSSKLDIIDCNPSLGLFSSMLNFELKPRTHLIMETKNSYQKLWKSYIKYLTKRTGNKENFILYEKDPYSWQSWTDLIEHDKIIQPVVKPDDKVHDELLVFANLASEKDEYLLAQWIGCCGDRNWIQKYGKVRIICLGESKTVRKFLAQPGFIKRNRASLKRDLYTTSKIHAIISNPEILPGTTYDPNLLFRDQPVAGYDAALARSQEIGIFEFYPSGVTSDAIAEIDYLLSPLFGARNAPIKEVLPKIVLGGEYMLQYLPPDLLERTVKDFTTEDILAVAHAHEKWPFKPDFQDTIFNDEILEE